MKESIKNHNLGKIDWITFVGSGETTLHASIGKLIRGVKSLTDIPIAVITNGSLLYQPKIRTELMDADAVMPSLDAGNAQLYKKINRPHPEATFARLVNGLIAFREAYQGKLWVEVMLIRDLNDTESALKEIAATLQRIQPDEVHIIQPTRPPVETWVQPPDEKGLLRARAILGDIAKIVHPASGSFNLSGSKTLVDAIVGIITRHPMRESELIHTLKLWSSEEINAMLTKLKDSGKAQAVERYGIRFWSASPSYYPSNKDEKTHRA